MGVKISTGYEGRQDDIKELKLPDIEVISNQYSEYDYNIHLYMGELNAVCPKSGLPDFYKLTVDYIPQIWIVELKSLKLYLTAYRNIGIFHEHLLNKIMDDFITSCVPNYVKMTLEAAARGGIFTTVTREWRAPIEWKPDKAQVGGS